MASLAHYRDYLGLVGTWRMTDHWSCSVLDGLQGRDSFGFQPPLDDFSPVTSSGRLDRCQQPEQDPLPPSPPSVSRAGRVDGSSVRARRSPLFTRLRPR